MPTEIKLPELGENIEEGDVVNVLVSAGDTIEKDQPIIEVETGKATLEVPADVGGKIQEVKVQKGDKVRVDQVLALIEAVAGAEKEKKAEATNSSASASEPAAVSENGQAAPEAAKAPAAVAAKKRGEGERDGRERPASTVGGEGRIDVDSLVPASPQVRRVARELGLDVRSIQGTGPNGRITVDDVKGAARNAIEGGGGAGGAQPSVASLPDMGKFGPVRTEAMSQVRKTTMQHIWRSWLQVPMVTQNDKADITDLEEFRADYGPRVEKQHGAKLSPTAILLKVCALAIQRYPKFGCSIDPQKNEIVYKDYIHIGVAVDTPRGLLVPVIRDVDKKGIGELAAELGEVSKRMREGKVKQSDIEGGCFSISNIGGIGGTFFSPIVNWPEVAILGVAKAEWEPRLQGIDAGDAEFEARLMMPLSLTYDHRIIDGADAARFLRTLAEAMEQPLSLLL